MAKGLNLKVRKFCRLILVCRRKTGRVNKQGGGGIKINKVSNIFAKFDKKGGRNLNKFVNIANKRKKRHKCLVLMLNIKVNN